MSKRPTIRDVAREAGVSVTTVSDSLNGKGRVDPITRERVVEVVRRLGYQANRHARGLRSGRAGALGLVLPIRGDPRVDEALSLEFYMRLASAAAASAFSRQAALLLLPPKFGAVELRGLALDGGIVVDPSVNDAHVALFEELGLPVVTIERDHGRKDVSFIASRTEENTRLMLDHLHTQGARKIALLLPKSDWGWVTESLAAYDAWTAERGLRRRVVPVSMQGGEQHAFDATARLLARRSPPDAIFVLASRFVRGALRAARTAGRTVPAELLLAAGVDSVQAREGDPPVTALELHPERQAEEAVEMLLEQLDGTGAPVHRYITATPIYRISTAAVENPVPPPTTGIA
jgi:DNA-binding LacI/PurR family transcriptional regulator